MGPSPAGKQESCAAKAAARKKELNEQKANAQQTAANPEEEEEVFWPEETIEEAEVLSPAEAISPVTPGDEPLVLSPRSMAYLKVSYAMAMGTHIYIYIHGWMRVYVEISNLAFQFDRSA